MMSISVRCVAPVAALFLAIPALADTNAVAILTLEDCVGVALRTGGAAALARYDQAIAGTLVGQAAAGLRPRVSVNGSYTRLDRVDDLDLGPARIATADENNASAGAHFSQVLCPGGGVHAALAAAKLGKRAADWTRADAEQRVIRDVRLAFYDVLAARSALKVQQEAVLQLGLAMRQTRIRFAEGTASEFDKLRSELDFANASRDLLRAKNDADTSMVALGRLLNMDLAAFDVTGELPLETVTADKAKLQARAARERPTVLAMASAIEAAHKDLAAARGSRLPSLVALLNYDWGNRFSAAELENEFEWHWTAGLGMEWNLWDGGRTAQLLRQKMLELEKARVEYAELAKTARMEVSLAWLEMGNAVQALEGRREEAELAAKALEIARTSYEAGVATYLDFVEANVAAAAARLGIVQALRRHAAATARLKYACGSEDLGE